MSDTRKGIRQRRRKRLATSAALAVGAALAPAGAEAATMTVSSLADTVAADSQCTLREAIANANDDAQTHADCVQSGVFGADTIDFGVTGTITMSLGVFSVYDSLTIQGPGASDLTIDAASSSQNFYLATPAGDVTISGLTLTNGDSGDTGGAIHSVSTNLTLDAVTINNSNAQFGAAVFAESSGDFPGIPISLTITDSTITGNDASNNGGGVSAVGLYGGTVSVSGSTISSNDAAEIGGGLYLYGVGAVTIQNTIISGNTASESGGINVNYTSGDVLIQNTEITGNQASVYDAGVSFFYINGTLTLDTVTLSDNEADFSQGGGNIFGVTGGTTITNSVISGNDAFSGVVGGLAWYAASDLTIDTTTISGNTANDDTGALDISGNAGPVTIRRTTISGNSAGGAAGGLYIGSGGDPVTIENSTISGNSAGGDGGGIYAYEAQIIIRHSTISGNDATVRGGNISLGADDASSLTLESSIVANGVAPVNPDISEDPSGVTITSNFSLIEDLGTSTIDAGANNTTGVDPQLGALQNNGGPTETHMPASTSPVINAGDPAFVPPPATDQRGLARVSNGRIEMGSVEVQAGVLQFLVTTDSVAENAGGGNIAITVTRTGGSEGAVSVPVSVAGGGTATGGGIDYTFAGTIVNFADGDAIDKTFNIPITNDNVFEGNETFTLQFGAPSGGATIGANSTETVTIVDDEVQPTISINDVALAEGDAATTNFQFVVSLSGPSATSISVDFTTNPVDATEGTDYADATGTLNFPALSTSRPINVSVAGETAPEPDETFNVLLSSPSGATIADDTGLGTIQNDDASGVLQFLVTTDNVAENVGGGNITITVTRTGGSDGAVSVPVSVAGGGTATGGGIDYTFAGTTVNFADGDAVDKTFNIPITNDNVFEGNETFTLQFGAPSGGATIGANSTETVTIVDDEVQPAISISDVSLAEGDAGTTNFQFLVSLSGPSATPISVDFTTNPVDATEGTDYADATGTVNFPALSTSQPIDVSVTGETAPEPDETFNVLLSSPSGATIADDTGIGTIQNDDVALTADLDTVKTAVGGGPFLVGQNVTFNIAVSNAGPGTATNVTVTDVIPAGTTFVSATPSAGSCSGTTTITCNVGTIVDGGNASVTLTVSINQAGPITNTATAVSDLADPTPATGSVTITAAAAAADAVPTLSEWMLMALAGAMTALAMLKLRK